MRVIATAGHVDHGKSSLLTALTGNDPDRLSEEKRRGLTIDLGFVSMPLAGGDDLAFVDVPGHRRYLSNTVAGIATAPAVLFVVAADEGWMPQSEEHLAAVHAFGIDTVLIAVTKSDLADPTPAASEARDRLRRSGFDDVPVIAVSARTGEGIDGLRQALDEITGAIAPPTDTAATRLWIDRVFTVAGAGTVVTGTLNTGCLYLDSQIALSSTGERLSIRGLQCLGRPVQHVTAPARVAVNLRRTASEVVRRGDALVAPGRWWRTGLVDVRLPHSGRTPSEVTVYCGTAAVSARVRRLTADVVRLTFATSMHLHNGERLLVRDTGSGDLLPGRVLDVAPPPLRGRGAAVARARELAAAERPLQRLGLARRRDLIAMGETTPDQDAIARGEWLIDTQHRQLLTDRLHELVERHEHDHPLDAGLPLGRAAQLLRLPDTAIIPAVAGTLTIHRGRLHRTDDQSVPQAIAQSAQTFHDAVDGDPFRAPTRPELIEHGLTPAMLAAAAGAGLLLRLGDVHLLPAAPQKAAETLARLAQPFTVTQARQALNTNRRVAIPLLEHLDAAGVTRRLPDGRRRVIDHPATSDHH